MSIRAAVLVVFLVPGFLVAVDSTTRSRTFDLTYQTTVHGLEAGKPIRIWVPVPPSTEDQDVRIISRELIGKSTVKGKTTRETRYGNQIFFAEVSANKEGKVEFKAVYRITRREVKGETGKKLVDDADRIARFLQADALVPITGKPVELIKGKSMPDDPLKKARVLYDVVNAHVRYSKEGTGWGRGDSVWVCDSKFGNCSDFHSLFISLARSQKIPAKFEIGYPLPPKRGKGEIGGYHCWAFFRPEGKRWVPVDISEANKDPKRRDYFFGNLDENRVMFSTGRDIDLVPKQADKPLNFFISPHVEVAGKVWLKEKIRVKVLFEDRE
jgi:transglutaminase-like putative cysteine protease